MTIKSVAIIGAGPAGAIAVDALAQEKAFDVIRVFDRQEKAGGCWYAHSHPPRIQGTNALTNETGSQEMINHPSNSTWTDYPPEQQINRSKSRQNYHAGHL
jgi:cation diffusion facilitator CzcD-associated flavoprotein CzcO